MKKVFFSVLAVSILASIVFTGCASTNAGSQVNELVHLGSYKVGNGDKDGGAAEIVAYNNENQKVYVVSGVEQKIQIVPVSEIISSSPDYSGVVELDSNVLGAMIPGFIVGDISSVAVSKDSKKVAIALQAEKDEANGRALVLDADGNFIAAYEVGVQPDMITFTPDSNYVLTANEGEPRAGYNVDTNGVIVQGNLTAQDPMGGVSIVNLKTGMVQTADFTSWDARRNELVSNNVLVKKGINPSTDFEPEYITMTDSKTAFVILQEANALATLDIENAEFTAINSLGFKDHNKAGNELDFNKEDKAIGIESKKFLGTYMPDGISSFESKGKTYILTANEGDGSEWGNEDIESEFFLNEMDLEVLDVTYDDDGEMKPVEIDGLNPQVMDGLPSLNGYIGHTFGARSFSIYEAKKDGSLVQVYDSGSDFERITAAELPEVFNTTNDEDKIDNRSDNKGPEPENVTVLTMSGRTFAYIGLERIGGVMLYDITNPQESAFVDYLNTREFGNFIEDKEIDVDNSGDVSPEGICVVAPEYSPNGKALLLTGNEVSGTVAVYEHSFR